MDTQHGHERYWTTFFEDRKAGCGGYQLHRERFGKVALVARTTYWDATGGFVFTTVNGEDVPVEIVESAMEEARREIKVR